MQEKKGRKEEYCGPQMSALNPVRHSMRRTKSLSVPLIIQAAKMALFLKAAQPISLTWFARSKLSATIARQTKSFAARFKISVLKHLH